MGAGAPSLPSPMGHLGPAHAATDLPGVHKLISKVWIDHWGVGRMFIHLLEAAVHHCSPALCAL